MLETVVSQLKNCKLEVSSGQISSFTRNLSGFFLSIIPELVHSTIILAYVILLIFLENNEIRDGWSKTDLSRGQRGHVSYDLTSRKDTPPRLWTTLGGMGLRLCPIDG